MRDVDARGGEMPEITVNGTARSLAGTPVHCTALDFLRGLGLTGAKEGCAEGECGACSVLVARPDGADGSTGSAWTALNACLVPAAALDGQEVVTAEGLGTPDYLHPVQRELAERGGSQCGYCTPGFICSMAAEFYRPDREAVDPSTNGHAAADGEHGPNGFDLHALSGNLCRCTGYVGIVRAIRRVLEERRLGRLAVSPPDRIALGPAGSQHAERTASAAAAPIPEAGMDETRAPFAEGGLGLGGRKPSIEIRRSLVIERPPQEVWAFLSDVERVVPCMPGATLTSVDGDRLRGRVAIKLGPIAAAFNGEARIIRDDAERRGTILGTGRDGLSGSRANAEIEYVLTPERAGTAARIDIVVRAVLIGPLAQFGRSGIVDDLAARLSDMFARNLERRLTGSDADG
jgi:aerobic-type carbon monoxide dehydrogenase small subunit (CoxS/CutS family)/carbon monoxide dehydrogenase subunit G